MGTVIDTVRLAFFIIEVTLFVASHIYVLSREPMLMFLAAFLAIAVYQLIFIGHICVALVRLFAFGMPFSRVDTIHIIYIVFLVLYVIALNIYNRWKRNKRLFK